MKENNAGLKSNLQKVDSHEISQAEYDEIPELPDAFFAEGKLYQNGRPMKRPAKDGKQEAQLAVRINKEIVEFFKARGEGWQVELNAVLQRHVDAKQAA